MHYYLTGNYTSAALAALGKNPTDRHAAAEKLVTAAGGKVISFYRTLAHGPGVHMVFDVDHVSAAAICTIVVAGGAMTDVKFGRLWTDDEVMAVRKRRAEIEASYAPPA